MLTDKNVVSESDNTVMVSGVSGYGIDNLLTSIENTIHSFKKKYTLIIPYDNQSVLSAIYNSYTVENVDYLYDGISVEEILDERGKGLYGKYIKSV